MRILAIEDEAKVGFFIRRALEDESAAVDHCSDGTQGLKWGLSGSYNLVVLDLMLSSRPGLEILKRIRQEGCKRRC